jgi:hypothetical protein
MRHSRQWSEQPRPHVHPLGDGRPPYADGNATLLCPAYCPFCLADRSLPASERWESWARDHQLWNHIMDNHIEGRCWFPLCPHPLCDGFMENVGDVYCYFVDGRRLTRFQPDKNSPSQQGKRVASGNCPASWEDSNGDTATPQRRHRVSDAYHIMERKDPKDIARINSPQLLSLDYAQDYKLTLATEVRGPCDMNHGTSLVPWGNSYRLL